MVLVVSAFLGVGIVVGRWWVVALPLIVWPLWYLGLHFVGPGLGDGWWIGLAVVTGASTVLAALGVLLRRLGRGRHGLRTGRP